MTDHTDTPADILLRWKAENPFASARDLEVCERLATAPDMAFAWPDLADAGLDAMQAFRMVTNSIRRGAGDAKRLAPCAETASLEAVDKAARQLLEALQGCQILAESAPLFTIGGDPVFLAFSGTSASNLSGDPVLKLPALSVPEILRAMRGRCEYLRENRPKHALPRPGGDAAAAEVRAFIRWLSREITTATGRRLHAAVSHITCCVYQRENNAVTPRDVEEITRDSRLRANF